jgi:hypothetical protein
MTNPIVVGTDGSPSAERAVEWAAAEAGRRRCRCRSCTPPSRASTGSPSPRKPCVPAHSPTPTNTSSCAPGIDGSSASRNACTCSRRLPGCRVRTVGASRCPAGTWRRCGRSRYLMGAPMARFATVITIGSPRPCLKVPLSYCAAPRRRLAASSSVDSQTGCLPRPPCEAPPGHRSPRTGTLRQALGPRRCRAPPPC